MYIDRRYGLFRGHLLQIAKVDVQNKKSLEWEEPGCHASEPVFVAKPGSDKEDDGKLTLISKSSSSEFGISLINIAFNFL